MGISRSHRGGTPDGVVEGALHPDTLKSDLAIKVDGKRLDFMVRHSLAALDDARHIPTALREPDALFETTDGDYPYYKQTGDRPEAVFFVRVRRTGWRAFVWDYEPADESDTRLPLAKDGSRMKRQIR